jgi:hypothetical protein
MDPNELIARATQKAEDCLSIDALEAAVAGAPSEAAKLHLKSCPHCQNEVALMSQFLFAEPTATELAAVKQIERNLAANPPWATSKTPWWKALFAKPLGQLAMAGVTLMLAFGIFVQSPTTTPVDGEDVVRSTAIEAVEPAGDVAQAPTAVRWRAVSKAASYRVQLLDVDDVAIWQSTAPVPQVEVPATARALMLNKKTLFWKIEALDAKGVALAQSTRTQIRVVSNPSQ